MISIFVKSVRLHVHNFLLFGLYPFKAISGILRTFNRDFLRMKLLFSEMKEMGITPNVVTCGIIINELCKSGRVDEALKVFDVMIGEGSEVKPEVGACN